MSYTYTPPTSSSGSAVAIGTLLSYSKSYDCDQSGRLIAENKTNEYYGEPGDSEKIVFLYDEAGMVGFVYTKSGTSNTYYYDRNIRGDVIGIYDENGVRIVKYSYDAWGNCTIGSSTTNISLARANPIRYRGYYYDEDTKLYYLNARYYCPEWRRFISPDSTEYLDPETPNGLNLYAYCNNDPINFADPTGHSVALILLGAFVLGAVTSGGMSFATQLIENDFDVEAVNPWLVFSDAMFGGVSGLLAVSGIGALGSAFLGASLNSLQLAVNSAISGDNVTAVDFLVTVTVGFVGGFIPKAGINAKQVSEKLNVFKMNIANAVRDRRRNMYELKKVELLTQVAGRARNYIASTIASSKITDIFSNNIGVYYYGYGYN